MLLKAYLTNQEHLHFFDPFYVSYKLGLRAVSLIAVELIKH